MMCQRMPSVIVQNHTPIRNLQRVVRSGASLLFRSGGGETTSTGFGALVGFVGFLFFLEAAGAISGDTTLDGGFLWSATTFGDGSREGTRVHPTPWGDATLVGGSGLDLDRWAVRDGGGGPNVIGSWNNGDRWPLAPMVGEIPGGDGVAGSSSGVWTWFSPLRRADTGDDVSVSSMAFGLNTHSKFARRPRTYAWMARTCTASAASRSHILTTAFPESREHTPAPMTAVE